jgi:hypothetical protein
LLLLLSLSLPQVALKALSLRGIKDWKQLELFQREAVVLQVCNPAGSALCSMQAYPSSADKRAGSSACMQPAWKHYC